MSVQPSAGAVHITLKTARELNNEGLITSAPRYL